MNALLKGGLDLIQMVLPLASKIPGSTGTIAKTLTTWTPLILGEIDTVYEPVKAIVDSLSGSGEVTAEDKASLKALSAKMDAAFEAAVAGLDPDADGQ